jgi:hypothetical protein
MSSPAISAARPWAGVSPRALVWWTIIITTVIRLYLGAVLGYGYGEGYYVATARHLALSYFDQPPLFLWIGWVAIKLFGAQSTFFMRLPFVLMFVGTTWGIYRLGALLFGERAGAWGAVLLNLSIVFSLSAGGWFQPDGPLMLFLVLAALAIARLRFEQPAAPMLLWLAAGAAFGLAMLSKYHAALIFAGLVIFVATTWRERRWLSWTGLLAAAIVATVIFLPVLIWNAQNEWVSFLFQGDRITANVGLHFDWLVRSIAGQAGIMNPVVWVPMIYVFFRALARGPHEPKGWFLACLAIVPIIVFTAAALWAPLGYHFHWQSPGYLFLFPLLGKFTAEGIEAGKAGARRAVIAAAAVMAIAAAFVTTQATLGWVGLVMPRQMTARVEESANPTREMLTWTELRPALEAKGYLNQPRLFAVAPQWHQAGKVDVQIGDVMPVVCLCHDPRNIAFGWDPEKFVGWDALIIATDNFLPDVHAAYDRYFDSIAPVDNVPILLGGRPDITVRVYLAHRYRGGYPLPIGPGGPRERQATKGTGPAAPSG